MGEMKYSDFFSVSIIYTSKIPEICWNISYYNLTNLDLNSFTIYFGKQYHNVKKFKMKILYKLKDNLEMSLSLSSFLPEIGLYRQ